MQAWGDNDGALLAADTGPFPRHGGVPRVATLASMWLPPDPSVQIAGIVLNSTPICGNPFPEQPQDE